MTLLGKYLTYALLAVAVDLVWGYLGILSLGHGAFFALGGYAMGMYLMRQVGDRGVYGNPELPDFMVFLNWQELPWFWQGFDQFWFAVLMVMVAPGLLAFVFGWLAFRSRVTGVYLSIITQALTYALMLAFFRNEMGFGGNNGLTDFKDILGFSLQSDNVRVSLFALSALALALGYLSCRYIVTSKLGRVSVAIRDSEDRVRFIGYRVEHFKLWVFTFSALLAGVAGALLAQGLEPFEAGCFPYAQHFLTTSYPVPNRITDRAGLEAQAVVLDAVHPRAVPNIGIGDRHLGEISRIELPGAGALYEVTASGLNSAGAGKDETNLFRVHDNNVRVDHFGLLRAEHDSAGLSVFLELRGVDGAVIQSVQVPAAMGEIDRSIKGYQ